MRSIFAELTAGSTVIRSFDRAPAGWRPKCLRMSFWGGGTPLRQTVSVKAAIGCETEAIDGIEAAYQLIRGTATGFTAPFSRNAAKIIVDSSSGSGAASPDLEIPLSGVKCDGGDVVIVGVQITSDTVSFMASLELERIPEGE